MLSTKCWSVALVSHNKKDMLMQSDSATERHPRHASHPAGTRFSSWSLAAKVSSLT